VKVGVSLGEIAVHGKHLVYLKAYQADQNDKGDGGDQILKNVDQYAEKVGSFFMHGNSFLFFLYFTTFFGGMQQFFCFQKGLANGRKV
jgi:hypothetical protein